MMERALEKKVKAFEALLSDMELQRDEWRAAACKMEKYVHDLVDCNPRNLIPMQDFYNLQDKYPL